MELKSNITAMLKIATLIVVCFTFIATGCNNDPDLERTKIPRKSTDATGKTTSGKKKTKGDKSSDKDDLSSDVDTESGSSSSDDDGDADDVAKEDEVIEYPQFDFKGNGYTTYELKDKLAMRMDIKTEMDEALLSVDTTAAKVECGSKDGCDQKDVDKKVNANSLGANVYTRISKDEIRDLKKEGADVPSYAIFAKSARSKQGINFTFSKAVPVYPWPGKMSRYEDLDNGPMSWTMTATADVHIPNNPDVDLKEARENGPNLERNGRAIKTFDVTVTFSKVATMGDDVRIKMEIDIPADKKRVLYEYFPMPKSTEYTIDTDAQNIMQVFMTSWSNGDRSKDPEESVLTYKICTRKTSRETREFGCQ